MPYVDAGIIALAPALILMAAAVVLTAAGVDAALAQRDSERIFWVGFTGLLTALLAVAWAVAESSGAAPLVGLLAVAAGSGAAVWVGRRERRRRAARLHAEFRGRIEALERRHDAVLLSWSAYETDAWKAVEKPGLTDLARPETKGLIRAMKAAAVLRPTDGAAADPADAGVEDYASAVEGLERAWETAEETAGGGRAA